MFVTDKKILADYTDDKRIWQGIPGIEVTKSGRVFVTFYTGKQGEQLGNYVLVFKSDNGVDFGDPIAVAFPKTGNRCYDAVLWIDPLDRLWLTWSSAPEYALYAVVCDDPDADELVWSKVRKIGNNVMMNKPTVLSTGEWLFPVAVWGKDMVMPEYEPDYKHISGSYAYITSDCGKSFRIAGKADTPKKTYDEHMVFERNDGVLVMYIRTTYGIGVSYSYDYGKTWTNGVDSGIKGPNSRFCVRRLKSGRLILVNHYEFDGRNNLTAFLSEDEGQTWKYRLLLDERNNVSYPDLKEADDGYIYIVYDRERGQFGNSIESACKDAREILYAKITEEDIINGKVSDSGSRLKIVANKLGEYCGYDKNPYGETQRMTDSELAQLLMATASENDIIEKLFDMYRLNYMGTEIDTKIDKFRLSYYRDTEILKEIIRIMRSADREENRASVVDLAMEYINNNYEKDFVEKDLAEILGCSMYHLNHEFIKRTGLTICKYHSSKRLTAAKYMLVNSEKSIDTIARECGFQSYEDFERTFIACIGMMPIYYRENLKNVKENKNV